MEGVMEERAVELVKIMIQWIEQYGFQPNCKEAALAMGLDPSYVRGALIKTAVKMGLITVHPGRPERCYGLNWVKFAAQPGPTDKEFPVEFLLSGITLKKAKGDAPPPAVASQGETH